MASPSASHGVPFPCLKINLKAKRIRSDTSPPKNAKRLRLDACSPDPTSITPLANSKPRNSMGAALSNSNGPSSNNQEGTTEDKANTTQSLISRALKTLQNSCFDLLPTVRNHVLLGRISEVPVLRDEEKSIISEFCVDQVNYCLRDVLFSVYLFSFI